MGDGVRVSPYLIDGGSFQIVYSTYVGVVSESLALLLEKLAMHSSCFHGDCHGRYRIASSKDRATFAGVMHPLRSARGQVLLLFPCLVRCSRKDSHVPINITRIARSGRQTAAPSNDESGQASTMSPAAEGLRLSPEVPRRPHEGPRLSTEGTRSVVVMLPKVMGEGPRQELGS